MGLIIPHLVVHGVEEDPFLPHLAHERMQGVVSEVLPPVPRNRGRCLPSDSIGAPGAAGSAVGRVSGVGGEFVAWRGHLLFGMVVGKFKIVCRFENVCGFVF